MNVTLNIPWHRYALISELAKRLNGVSPQFGKTALQKLVYFLQELYGVDCGYDFQLYSYGPFTSQLLGDLDLVEHFGCVSVEPVHSITGGYEIRPTEKADSLQGKAVSFLNNAKTKQAIDSLVSEFGAHTAKDLELRATIVYVERGMHRKSKHPTMQDVCRLVGQIKPKFSSQEIKQAVDDLRQRSHVLLAV
jgi:uncharacterized protein